jgi:hypothetical protein
MAGRSAWTKSHVFEKTRYIEYTDGAFSTRTTAGMARRLGPSSAPVGDTVIAFRNMAESGSYGMHPHGFRYTKDNEGAFYTGVNSGVDPGAGANIPPGGCFDYTWIADEASGFCAYCGQPIAAPPEPPLDEPPF